LNACFQMREWWWKINLNFSLPHQEDPESLKSKDIECVCRAHFLIESEKGQDITAGLDNGPVPACHRPTTRCCSSPCACPCCRSFLAAFWAALLSCITYERVENLSFVDFSTAGHSRNHQTHRDTYYHSHVCFAQLRRSHLRQTSKSNPVLQKTDLRNSLRVKAKAARGRGNKENILGDHRPEINTNC